jgi:ribonuclease P protein component
MGKGLGFPRERRIKQGRDFLRIKTEGKRLGSGCLLANWALSGDAPSRLGVVTSRAVGDAVTRNRARRLLREAFRVHQLDLCQPVDMVLVARPSIVGKHFQEVERDLLAAFRRGGLLKDSP